MAGHKSTEQRVWLLRGIIFAQAWLVVQGRVVAYAGLLQSAGGGRALPWVYLGQAVVIGLLTLGLFGVVDRVGRASLMAGMFAVFALGIAAASAVPVALAPTLAPALLLFVESGITIVGIHFWLLASELLSPEQSRRLFPSFTLVGAFGAAAGGATGQLAPFLGARGMTLLLLFPALACCGLALVTGRRYAYRVGARADSARSSWPAELRTGLGILSGSALLRWVGLLTALVTASGVLVDYLFSLAAASVCADGSLPAFLGTINIVVSIAQLALVTLLGSRLLTTFGLIRTFTSYPVGGGLAVLAGVPAGLAGSAIALKIFDRLENYLILNPGLGIALGAFPRERRGRASFIFGGLIKPAATASTGALLLALGAHPVVLWIVIGTALAAFFPLLGRLSRVYRNTLLENLRLTDRRLVSASIEALAEPDNRVVVPQLLEFLRRNDDPALAENVLRAAGTFGDPRFVPALLKALESENSSMKIAAAGSLRRFAGDEVRDALLATLRTEQSSRVKASIIAALGADLPALHPVLLAALKDPEARVRANAVEAIGLSGNPTLVAELRPLLQTESPRAIANVIVALARIPSERAAALAALGNVIEGGPRSVLASALWAVGEVGDLERLPMLRRLVGDSDPMVSRNAVIALGKLEQPDAVEPLVALLRGPSDGAQAVARALDRLGPRERESVLMRLSSLPRAERASAIDALANCGLNYPEELEQLR